MNPPNRSRLREVGENRMVARFRQLAEAACTSGVVVGPGDDAAVIRVPEYRAAVLTCDMMVEGVHFRREWATPWQIGWKAMAVSLSDIAAMGAEPGFAVASVSLPGEAETGLAEGIAEGLIAAASQHGAALVGGDLVGSTGPIVVDVAVLGWVEQGTPLRRTGARPRDAIVVTGALGASAAGLLARQRGFEGGENDPEVEQALQAHLTPQPRVKEGRVIAATRRATAMMDLSDGLAMDLPRLCAESGVGARIWADKIPIARACVAVAVRAGLKPLPLATSGGEDYELLFTCWPDSVSRIADAVSRVGGAPVTVIGEVLAERDIMVVDPLGRELGLGRGFDQFAAAIVEAEP